MLRTTVCLFVAVFLLGGCRETISGPALPIVDPVADPAAPSASVAPIYIKGPTALRNGDLGSFRAEPLQHPELERYEWRVLGLGRLSIEVTDPTGLDRLIAAEATRVGSILLTVRAFAHDGTRIGYGERAVEISNR